jgi:hypothetical protein
LAHRAARCDARLAVAVVVPVTYLALLAKRLIVRGTNHTVGAARESEVRNAWRVNANQKQALAFHQSIGEDALGADEGIRGLAYLAKVSFTFHTFHAIHIQKSICAILAKWTNASGYIWYQHITISNNLGKNSSCKS